MEAILRDSTEEHLDAIMKMMSLVKISMQSNLSFDRSEYPRVVRSQE
jgi:hypothetical protein